MLIIRNILEKERARERETLLGDTVRLNSKAVIKRDERRRRRRRRRCY